MNKGVGRRWSSRTGGPGLGIVALLAAVLLALNGCSSSRPEEAEPVVQEVSADEAAQDETGGSAPEADATQEGETKVEDIAGGSLESVVEEFAGDTDATATGADGTSFDSWAAECLDQNGDVTVYAISELKGWQLETLMQQQEYSWSTRNQLWVNKDDSVAVAVFGTKGEELTDDRIAELGFGSVEGSAGYRIVTSRYDTPEKAFEALAGEVMVCEDSEFTETSGVAVVYGPTMHRSLVFVSTSNDVVFLSVYSEDAVKAGLFNDVAGRDLGSTVGETFAALTGRIPGAEH